MDDHATEYSPYAVCYDISKTDERPKHTHWVVPHGTTMLVDFDSPVKRAYMQGYQAAMKTSQAMDDAFNNLSEDLLNKETN